jgi:hypothetical protein
LGATSPFVAPCWLLVSKLLVGSGRINPPQTERGQEGLLRDATIEASRTIYFPAQQIHFARDDPCGAATAIVTNDPRLV